MNKNDFRQFLENKYIFLDGATGSCLTKAGMPAGVCPEKWILENPSVLINLQKDYIKSGSMIIQAPTFGGNRIKLSEYGLQDRFEEINTSLVALSMKAREEAGIPGVLIAGDMTMTGQQLAPLGPMKLETLIEIYKEQILVLEKAGVDVLVLETMMSLAEVRAFLIAAKEVTELPVMVTFTFEKDGRTLFGTDGKTAAIVAASLGADAVGVNCSTGPAAMKSLVQSMAEVTNIPLIAKPNAGLPLLDENNKTYYDLSSQDFVEEMKVLAEAGATLLGGCCGTSPEYIRGLKDFFETREPNTVKRRTPGVRFLTSERKTLSFGLNDPFIIVGERINPTGKKALQAQLREGSLELVREFAESQESNGASVLDVNMGLGGIDEKQMMLHAIEEVTQLTSLPLSLDSSSVEVLEAALRNYPGRALVNSVSLESVKYNELLPIVAKYGAAFILLPLSDDGLPKDIEEKKKIIATIEKRAYELGMAKEDIIVDGLVQTVGANPNAGVETLETIRYCKENGFATICGLSNISFGMPERSYVNATFLALAIQNGLTMAISNPSSDLLVCTALATDLLLAKEGSDMRYIEKVTAVKEAEEIKKKEQEEKIRAQILSQNGIVSQSDHQTVETTAKTESKNGFSPSQEKLYNALLKGNKSGIQRITEEALSSGSEPQSLLNDVLIPGINQVGDFFDSGKYFLPQLIASAEAMKLAIEVLEPLLAEDSDDADKPVVIIATVEGDIHDIGKNLVSMMLKNYGFDVHDLGKDVPGEVILSEAEKLDADLICLSALMTTTMQRMGEIIEEVKRRGLKAKVMIGGAVTTPEYAEEINADGYSKDAADAVKLAKRLLGLPL